jgi:hypothetical protein
MPSEIWIGTVEICYFHSDTPDKRKNAFTTITTWARSPEEFNQKCSLMLESYGWKLLGVDRANPAGDYYAFSDELADMLERTRINQNAIIYGTFHAYPVM